MKTFERASDAANAAETDLLELQLRIARRADELAQARARARREDDDRECWLEAEREVLKDPGEAVAT